jgi:SAM-dependent methyltransferase/uncharacterized protein YbaR (Trm112 family)
MSLRPQTTELLRCPFCASGIRVKRTLRPAADGGIEHGLLECPECKFDYPVVDGIAILMAPHESVDAKYETTALTLLEGPKVWDVTAALQAGEPVRALSLLFNPSALDGNWFPQLDLKSAGERRPASSPSAAKPQPARLGRAVRKVQTRGKRAAAKYALPHARLRLADFLKVNEDSLSALDVIDLYYRQFSGAENFNYFAYRFGQPRHLAALSLASLLDASTGPVLDLACGVGHLTHYLTLVRPQRTVVGVDRDFVRLWIANRFVAPGASYVCASADQALPFADKAFHGVFCSDAFHCFLQKAASVREMLRTSVDDGIVILARFSNAAVAPREGHDLTLDGYSRLFGNVDHAFVGEDALVKAYSERRRADLDRGEPGERLRSEKWVSVVASRRGDVFRRGEAFSDWPHAIGRLQLNPIYAADPQGSNGELSLRFQFPSEWYRLENEGYLAYAPQQVLVPRHLVHALERGERSADLERYVKQFVVIGMPEHYLEAARQ